MGKYINQIGEDWMPSNQEGKCGVLLDHGAEEIEQPEEWREGLVCVVDNGMFAAAAFCESAHELEYMTVESDMRPKRWFIFSNAKKYAE